MNSLMAYSEDIVSHGASWGEIGMFLGAVASVFVLAYVLIMVFGTQ